MVIYRGADGKPGYHQTDDIHDAVGFVERIRNEKGVEHARIFRLEEVVFEYQPYFRVRLAPGDEENSGELAKSDGRLIDGGGDDARSSEMDLTQEGLDTEVEDDPDMQVATNGARRGLFGR